MNDLKSTTGHNGRCRSAVLLAMGVFCLLSLSAQAVVVDFRTGGFESGPYYGNQIVFDAGDVDVEVSAWSWNTWDDQWEQSHLGQSSFYGLYNRNGRYDNSHTIDNQGWIDYVQFSFSDEVDLRNVHMYVFADGDFDYWTESTTGNPDGTGAPSSGGIGVSHGSSGWVSLYGNTDYLLIGAQYFNSDINRVDQDDKFKITALHFSSVAPIFQPVPEGGATVALMGMAFVGIAGVRRRFKR